MADGDQHTLTEVSDSGETLQFLDGTEWSVNPGDMPTAILWLLTATIEVMFDEAADLAYPYAITIKGTPYLIAPQNHKSSSLIEPIK